MCSPRCTDVRESTYDIVLSSNAGNDEELQAKMGNVLNSGKKRHKKGKKDKRKHKLKHVQKDAANDKGYESQELSEKQGARFSNATENETPSSIYTSSSPTTNSNHLLIYKEETTAHPSTNTSHV